MGDAGRRNRDPSRHPDAVVPLGIVEQFLHLLHQFEPPLVSLRDHSPCAAVCFAMTLYDVRDHLDIRHDAFL